MEKSPFDPDDLLLHELTLFNVEVDRTNFFRISREIIVSALDSILELVACIPQDDNLAFVAYDAFILFRRLILCSLPHGCDGKHVVLALARRCKMNMESQVSELICEAHDSHVTRLACRVHALAQRYQNFPLISKAAALVRCGAVGKARKRAFSYGIGSSPIVAASFLAKLIRTIPHSNVPLSPSSYKIVFVPMPIKAKTNAFTYVSIAFHSSMIDQ